VPEIVDPHDGRRHFVGFAIAVPDVARLATFCEELPALLKHRGTERWGFRPREAVIDLVVESALDLARRLADQVKHRAGEHSTMDLVLGVEVFHAEKRGNNVVLLGTQRVDPDPDTLSEYGRLRGEFWDPFFRRTRLLNLLKRRPWHAGFDEVAATLPHQTQTIGSKNFRHDARRAFELERHTRGEHMADDSKTEVVREPAELVYQLVGTYVRRRVKARTKMEWKAVKDNPQQRQSYEDEKQRVARGAFLAVRSRTGADFVDYFTGTICSVPQHLRKAEFAALSRSLRDDPASIRSLTLLALSACG
jgi:CRISPR-associated protein Cmx8